MQKSIYKICILKTLHALKYVLLNAVYNLYTYNIMNTAFFLGWFNTNINHYKIMFAICVAMAYIQHITNMSSIKKGSGWKLILTTWLMRW